MGGSTVITLAVVLQCQLPVGGDGVGLSVGDSCLLEIIRPETIAKIFIDVIETRGLGRKVDEYQAMQRS